MSLASFTYSLPVLLGYALFVGISGRFDPVSRPRRLAERPSWALGLWFGLATALTLMILPRLDDGIWRDAGQGTLVPATWLLATLSLPGLVAWTLYRGAISHRLEERARIFRERTMHEGVRLDFPTDRSATVAAHPTGSVVTLDGPAPRTVRRPATDIESMSFDVMDGVPREQHEAVLAMADDELGTMHLALCTEQELREESEKHLRIMRRALGVLESESTDRAGGRTDTLIALEEELENRIREHATTAAQATREAARRFEAETEIVTLKQDVLAARRVARRGTEARAKALSAATRSVALARQAVQARERAERRLHECEARLRESETSLASRQNTIGSLIGALERERRRTRRELVAAGQRVPQPQARRASGEREGVESRLTTRPERKVARARPLPSGG